MANWEIKRYDCGEAGRWDSFVKASRNGTFLLERGFMDYHSDRFEDNSLMAFKDGHLRGVLPADITADGWLHSHRGLTYGGWITPRAHFDANDMIDLFAVWLEQCLRDGIKGVDYKPIPWIYPETPAQEDIYALFRTGGRMSECNVSSALVPAAFAGFNTQQKRNLKKGLQAGGTFDDDVDTYEFHSLLTACLAERHGVSPVHTAAELQLLRGRFPENIRIHGCRCGSKLEAAVCIFLSRGTAHCQYIATTPEGRGQGLLTLLFEHLIRETYRGARYFDFGISNEDRSLVLNHGLLRQKASLGGTAVSYTRWELIVNSE